MNHDFSRGERCRLCYVSIFNSETDCAGNAGAYMDYVYDSNSDR